MKQAILDYTNRDPIEITQLIIQRVTDAWGKRLTESIIQGLNNRGFICDDPEDYIFLVGRIVDVAEDGYLTTYSINGVPFLTHTKPETIIGDVGYVSDNVKIEIDFGTYNFL